MIPPKKVKVGSSVYSMDIVDKYPEDFGIDPLYGATDPHVERIFLKRGQSEGQLQDTALHEVLHAIFSRAGMSVAHAKEERIISRLVPWLLLVLQDNPKLVAYLTERVK